MSLRVGVPEALEHRDRRDLLVGELGPLDPGQSVPPGTGAPDDAGRSRDEIDVHIMANGRYRSDSLHLHVVHRRDHDRTFVDEPGGDRERELEIAEPATLAESGAVRANRDTTRDDEVDRRHVGDRDGASGSRCALDRRGARGSVGEVVGIEHEEWIGFRKSGHGHVDELAVLQCADAHGELRRIRVRLEGVRARPLVARRQHARGGLRSDEVRDPVLRTREAVDALLGHRPPHAVAQRGLLRQQCCRTAGILIVTTPAMTSHDR